MPPSPSLRRAREEPLSAVHGCTAGNSALGYAENAENLRAADDTDEVQTTKNRSQVRKTKGEQITGKTNFVLFADFYYDCDPTNGPGPLPKQKPPH
jgi:hypothetical protein